MSENLHLTPYLIQTSDGRAIPAEWGRILVRENRTNLDSNWIEIPFLRVLSPNSAPNPPVFYLTGGPGFSILDKLDRLDSLYSIPENVGDLIVIEQRGVGQSRPCLDSPGSYNLPLDRPASHTLILNAHRAYIRQAVDFWQGQGVDLQGYNVVEMAADVNELRQALGYDRIQLLGGSFGSHHSFAVLRAFGEHITRAVLWGVEGPDHCMKLPQNVQDRLVVLDRRMKSDPLWRIKVPSLMELMAGVLDFLDRYPVSWEVKHPESRKLQRVTFGKYDLQWITANGLGDTHFIKALPARYYAMSHGDYTWLAEAVFQARTERRGNLAYELVDFASGASQARRVEIVAQTDSCLLGDVTNETLFDLGEALGNPDIGEAYRSDLDSEVPTLLIAGELDARTPVANAEEVLRSLSNGQLLEIKGASHDLARRGDHLPALFRIRDRFLHGEDVSQTVLEANFRFDPPDTVDDSSWTKNL